MAVYNLVQVFQLRDKIYETFYGLPGLRADQDILTDMVLRLTRVLPASIDGGALWASLRDFAGIELTEATLYDLAWRLAGNLPTLKSGAPVRPWLGQGELEWVPLQVIMASPQWYTSKKVAPGKPELYFDYRLRALAGSIAAMVLSKRWSAKFVRWQVAPALGFTATWGQRPFADGVEVVNMRFLGELDPQLCRPGQPMFERIRCPDSMQRSNRELMLMRWRDGFDCPMGWAETSVPCYKCPKGYVSCPAACHPEDYLWGPCAACQQDGWFDPQRSLEKCLNCL